MANGMIERFHCQLKASFMASTFPLLWTERLSFIMLGIRTSLHSDSSINFAELTFGTTFQVPREFIWDSPIVLVDNSDCTYHLLFAMHTLVPQEQQQVVCMSVFTYKPARTFLCNTMPCNLASISLIYWRSWTVHLNTHACSSMTAKLQFLSIISRLHLDITGILLWLWTAILAACISQRNTLRLATCNIRVTSSQERGPCSTLVQATRIRPKQDYATSMRSLCLFLLCLQK